MIQIDNPDELKMWMIDEHDNKYHDRPDYHAFNIDGGRWHISRYLDGTWKARFWPYPDSQSNEIPTEGG